MRTGAAFRTRRINQSKRRRLARQRTFAEWFADSLVHGKAAGPMPDQHKSEPVTIPRRLTTPPFVRPDNVMPWE
jgi:hypothetical protein